MAYEDDSEHRGKAVLSGLAAMVAVTAVLAGVASLAALGAARVVGVGGQTTATSTERASLYVPEYRPSEDRPRRDRPSRPEASTDPTPSTEPTRRPVPAIRLRVAPARVGVGEEINLSGSYRRGEGATLQVQRKEGRVWTDFADVTATVAAGRFDTYVTTTRTGPMQFRLLDREARRASNPVTVTVG